MKRILFVDDEPRILDGLQRLLRPLRREWDMHFAVGGLAALEQLRQRPFDVVVSDMRMPLMDGATLLGRVRDEHPQVARIVLSGYSEQEVITRTVPVAHQYLTKPCDAEVLKDVVERVYGVRSLLEDPLLQRMIGELGELPSHPSRYAELSGALADPECSLDRVAAIVEHDMAMCAKVLQLVNSAFFGLSRRVSSIRQAVGFLGMSMLRTLLFSAEVFKTFSSGGASERVFDEIERHALLAASIARRLLPEPHLADEASMGAMLHHSGNLVLASRLPTEFGELTRLASEQQRPIHELERELLGVTHAEIGAYLLGLWGLPWSIVEAVACHHSPARAGTRAFDVVGAVYVAGMLASEALDGDGAARSPHGELDRDYLEAVKVFDRLDGWRSMAAELAAQAEA